jgi:hypothetical protein
MAEQLRFDERVGNRAATDSQEWPVKPIALSVNKPGDQLLTGACLARDQDSRSRRCNTTNKA